MTAPRPLPIGWKKVPATGIPSDVGTPPDEWETTAHPQFPREEIHRWVRGDRYVRICIVEREGEEDSYYYLHFGRLSDPETDNWNKSSSKFQEILKEAHMLMRIGGYPA